MYFRSWTSEAGKYAKGHMTEQEGNGPRGVASNRAMKMASDLKPATSITLESICILLLKATFMASEAVVASK